MSQTRSTEVRNAEVRVARSEQRFESAMDHLAERVEATSRKVHSTLDTAKRVKTNVLGARDRAITSARFQVTRVRQNPTPYIATVVGILVAGFVFRYLRAEEELNEPMVFT